MDIDSLDYTDPSLTSDPYRLLDYLAAHQPVYREPHHGVVMVTGHEEAIAVLRAPTCSPPPPSSWGRTRVPVPGAAGRATTSPSTSTPTASTCRRTTRSCPPTRPATPPSGRC